MQKKNLIYILGGAAIVGYLIYMKRKSSGAGIKMPSQPSEELAPSFVNTAPSNVAVARKVARSARPIVRSRKTSSSPAMNDEVMDFTSAPKTAMQEVMKDMQDSSAASASGQGIAPAPLSARLARQAGKSTAAEVRAAGGSRKEGRQAAKVVRRDARSARKMGDLPLTF